MNTTPPAHPTEIPFFDDCPPTGLTELPELARLARVARVFVKLECERPLGNFKVLGGMTAGLRALAQARAMQSENASTPLRLICASDGNHGLSVAAAARHAGASAMIHLPETVSRARADRIKAIGGDIAWIRGTYDDAVTAAATAAARGDGILIPDTAEDPGNAIVRDVMAGYRVITDELVAQFNDIEDWPGHLFIQAGVGGLAAAMAEGLGSFLREPRALLTVEPEHAACVAAALHAGRPVRIAGDLKTSAEMLSCGLASAPALEILQRHRAQPLIVPEDRLLSAVELLMKAGGPETTPSGAAGLAGLMHVAMRRGLRARHRLEADSKVLLIITEGAIAD